MIQPTETSTDAPRFSPSRILGGILLLGAALRFYQLGHESFWIDEAYVAMAYDRILQPWLYFDPNYTNDEPLFHLVMGVWERFVVLLPGIDRGEISYDIALRVMPAVLGVLSIAGAFWLAKLITSNVTAALVTAFLIAISPFQIYYAQDIRPYTWYVVLGILSLAALYRALETNQRRYWIAFVLVTTISIYSRFFTVFNVAAMNLYFVCFPRRHLPMLRTWIVANLSIIALSAPTLWAMLSISSVFEAASEDWYPRPDPKTILISFKNFFAGYSPQAWAYRILMPIVLGLLGYGAYGMRKRPRELTLLLVMAFAPMLIAVVYWGLIAEFPYYTHRLMIFSAVPASILVGLGVAGLPRPAFRAGILAAVAVLTIPALTDFYAQRLHPIQKHTAGILYKPDFREAAFYVRGEWQEGDIALHCLRSSLLPFWHYMGWDTRQKVIAANEDFRHYMVKGYPNLQLYKNNGSWPYLFDEAIEPGDTRFWYVETWWEPFIPNPFAPPLHEMFEERATLIERTEFDGVTVYLYELRP